MTSFRSQVGSLLFLVAIFLLNFLSRVTLAPLMPMIEKELRIGHEGAGSLFFLVSLGYCTMVLGSGFVSSRLTHRKTIILSAMAVGIALLMIGLTPSLWGIGLELILLGMAAGLYLPSGISTITGLVDPKDWGKAVAIHELAPNLGYMIAPLLSEVLLGWFSWRGVLMVLGIISVLTAVVFSFFGKGGDFHGDAPNSRVVRNILFEPTFWIMVTLFALGIGASLGVYAMIPLYLVSERGMERTWANTLLGLSRVSTVGVVLLGGWVTDRLGPKQTLKLVFLSLGLTTILLGKAPESWIILIVFIQPMVTAWFFPPGFVALSRIGSPSTKNVVVAFTVPVGYLLGGGAIPAGIGFVGEVGSFSLAFTILGGLLLCGFALVRYLKFIDLTSAPSPDH